ncbi:MAG: PilZ domain-containing protein [Silvibacterium sp.]
MEATKRAERYEIHAVIHYRPRRAKEWLKGVIQNISTSGVLIHTDQVFPVGTAIEMRFALPVNWQGKAGADVFCRGVVVRSSSAEQPAGVKFIALVIEQSRLRRPVM